MLEIKIVEAWTFILR